MANTIERPLPALTPENEWFWTGGREGELRVRQCADCSAYVFPTYVMCGQCRSTNIPVTVVSGRATVVGATVNHHQWLPGMPPPYVVAIVAIEEDDRVRFTTNIVDCEPESVVPGMRVAVQFVQQEDVWFPVFAPTGDTTPAPVPFDPPSYYEARPMVTKDKFEHKVAISGIGMSDVGRRLMRDPVSLTVEACMRAIEDAGLRPEDIDGLSTYPSSGSHGHSEGGVTAVENALRLRPTWFSGGPETPGQSGSIVNAMLAVASGLCRHVLCFRTVWEATYAELQKRATSHHDAGRVEGEMMSWRLPYGASSAANWIGMNASLHMHRYGTTRETLGWIALNARRNAALNPTAIYRTPITMDEYLSARMITTPFGLYDCDVPCDGATAVIVSAVDTAKDGRQPLVRVEAVGTQITEPVSWEQGTVEHEPMLAGPAAHLWSRTDLKQSDIDVALLYDGFTFNCLSWIEALGFCGKGEGKDFVDGGTRIALDGELPLNPHGGQLSAGRLHGYGFVHEAVLQMRGTAGERQVRDAEVALVSTGGGTPGGCIILTKG